MIDFYFAFEKEDPDLVQKLILQNRNLVNSKDYKGRTPLILATRRKNFRLCEILLKAEADPKATNKLFGNTAEDLAKLAGNTNVIQLFSENLTKK